MKLFWQKKKQFPTALFVAASLLAFITFFNLFIIFSLIVPSRNSDNRFLVAPIDRNRYFFDEDFNITDPYITRVPNIENILVGPIITPFDPSIGTEDAPVVIVQFSDFECQACREQEAVLNKAFQEYPDKIRIVWKDFPEKNINSPSYQAAIAARCAAEQNKFWSYHDKLYQSESLERDDFLRIAGDIGLNKEQFTSCLDAGEVENIINDNILEASALDINGIPFIYVNKQEILGSISFDDLDKIINLELGKID